MSHAKTLTTIMALMFILVLVAGPAVAQTPKILFNFDGPLGASPQGSLTLSGSTLYGITYGDGDNNYGTVFRIPTIGGSPTILYSFSGDTDGANPRGSLTLSGSTLYGMTFSGGNKDCGTVFSLPTSGGLPNILYSFSGDIDGGYPYGSLTLSGSILYGMTNGGGNGGYGTVFRLPTSGGLLTILYSFSGTTDGAGPLGDLTLSGSTLYGMTSWCGAYDEGTIFSLPTCGGTPTVLYSFSGVADGGYPYGSLTLSGSTLYGMTVYGGDLSLNNGMGDGVIFSLPKTGGAPTILFAFDDDHGASPYGNLTLSGSLLFGMTYNGGDMSLNNNRGDGTIFCLPTSGGGAPNILCSFTGSNGALPLGLLTLSGSTLYGMTSMGGDMSLNNDLGDGTVFSLSVPPQCTVKVTPPIGGTVTVMSPQGTYSPSAVVTITASGYPGSSFVGWLVTGGTVDSNTSSQTLLTVKGNVTLSASFLLARYPVTVHQSTGGAVTLSPSLATYTYSQTFTLTATASPGYVFDYWTVSGSGMIFDALSATTTLMMNGSAEVVTATFLPVTVKYTVTDLGLPEYSGMIEGLNNSGQVVCSTQSCGLFGFTSDAFIWFNGSKTDLGSLGGPNGSCAQGINNAGQVTGQSSLANNAAQDAFIWSSGSMTDLGNLGGLWSQGCCINNSGQVFVISSASDYSQHCLLYSSGSMTDLGTLGLDGNPYIEPVAMNDAAQVVGAVFTDTTNYAFLYSNGVVTDLGTLGGPWCSADDINNAGQVVGCSAVTPDDVSSGNPPEHAFLYSNGSMTDLGTLGGQMSYAEGINNAGQIVGGSDVTAGNVSSGAVGHAFIYSNSVMADLNGLIDPGAGWMLQEARFINDHGQIVGYGINRAGQAEAFLLTPISSATGQALTVQVNQTGGGTVTVSPNQATYSPSTVVTITAAANPGYKFVSWSATGGTVASMTSSHTLLTVKGNVTLSASYVQIHYPVTVRQSTGGAVTLSQSLATYTYGQTGTLTATTSTGYTFVNWSVTGGSVDSITSSQAVLTVSSTCSVTASYYKIVYSDTLANVGSGTFRMTPSNGPYYYNTVVGLTASASTGWQFVNWSATGASLTSSSAKTTSLTVLGDFDLTATFAAITYSVSGIAGPAAGGTVSVGSATGTIGQVISISQTTTTGCSFAGWLVSDGGHGAKLNSDSASITLGSSNVTITASYVVSRFPVTVHQSTGGTVTLSPSQATYAFSQSGTLTATANTGSNFVSWSVTGGSVASTTSSKTVLTVTSSCTVTASYTQTPYTVTVTPQTGGTATVSPSQAAYAYGQTGTLTASANPGYNFVSWSVTGGTVALNTSSHTLLTVKGNVTLTASYHEIVYSDILANVGGKIQLTPSHGPYYYGIVVGLTASASTGWQFVSWSSTGASLTDSSAATTSLTVLGNFDLTANFSAITYGVSGVASPTAGGTVSVGSVTGTIGQVISISRSANPGYHFTGWTMDDGGHGAKFNSGSASITLGSSNVTVTAGFALIHYPVTVRQSTGGAVTLSPSQATYTYSQTGTLTATATTSYNFVSWSVTGGSVDSNTSTQTVLTVTGTCSVTASYHKIVYSDTTTDIGSGTIRMTPSHGPYYLGTVVGLTASANPGWKFVSWSTTGAAIISASSVTTSLTVNGDFDVTANFSAITYNVSAVANPAAGGSVNVGSATGTIGQVISISQTANTGYGFTGWTVSDSGHGARLNSGSATITLGSSNVTVTASFTADLLNMLGLDPTISPSTHNYSGSATITNVTKNKSIIVTDSVKTTAIASGSANTWTWSTSHHVLTSSDGDLARSQLHATEMALVWQRQADGIYLTGFTLSMPGKNRSYPASFAPVRISPSTLPGTFSNSTTVTVGDGILWYVTGRATLTTTLGVVQAVTVPAGTFQANKVTFKFTMPVSGWILDVGGTGLQISCNGTWTETMTFYAVPGVGIVKATSTVTASGTEAGIGTNAFSGSEQWDLKN